MIKFLHMSDVHLGCRRYNIEERTKDFFRSWYDVIQHHALPNEVDFVLIAGDFFDRRNIDPQTIAHVLVTEYSPGTAIGWHKDRPHFDDVIGISLASECVFRLRRKAGSSWQRRSIILAPRSAYVMRGSVRNEWEHSIPAVANLRYSITFRNLRMR